MGAWKVVESDILSRREVEMVWAELCRRSVRSRNTRQTRVIFCLATFCGLRNSEICGLRLRDAKLDIPRPILDIPAGVAKGLKPRQVPLWKLPTALACLSAWKAQRQGQGAGAMDPLVCAQSRSTLGRPLDRRKRPGAVHLRLRGAGAGTTRDAHHPLRPSLLRQPPSGGGLAHPGRAGHAGSREPVDDQSLQPCRGGRRGAAGPVRICGWRAGGRSRRWFLTPQRLRLTPRPESEFSRNPAGLLVYNWVRIV